jgi:methyltransferase (TIGR00027 family)
MSDSMSSPSAGPTLAESSADSGSLPDLSAMLKVGQLRHIQCMRGSGPYWNPDVLVGRLLTPRQRWTCFWRGRLALRRLCADPFYDYLLARTKYYDDVFLEAIYAGARTVVNIGAGSDTRAYRYAHHAVLRGASVIECDQADAIAAKRTLARRHFPAAHVSYLPIDLNRSPWEDLANALSSRRSDTSLVMLEGVAPYVDAEAYIAFLRMLSRALQPGSRVAYDYKIRGRGDDAMGRTSSVARPFRLGDAAAEVTAFHEGRGLRVVHHETSGDLARRLLPGRQGAVRPPFAEDGLVQLEVE